VWRRSFSKKKKNKAGFRLQMQTQQQDDERSGGVGRGFISRSLQ
jgi:hypothetical protein